MFVYEPPFFEHGGRRARYEGYHGDIHLMHIMVPEHSVFIFFVIHVGSINMTIVLSVFIRGERERDRKKGSFSELFDAVECWVETIWFCGGCGRSVCLWGVDRTGGEE